jgi:hypothetical protein
MIIGIVGFLGSGKGTVGDVLIQNYGFYKLSFADAVKDAVSVIFSWPRHLLEGDTQESREFREKPDAFWSKRFGYEVTPRYMLQLMGTEAGRDVFHKDIWIHALERKLAMFDNVVVPDVRFPNEIDFIRKVRGKIVRVKRGPEPDWYDLAHAANSLTFLHAPEAHDEMSKSGIHYSEWAWVGQEFDHVIDNDGSIEDLKNKLNNIMEKLN